MLVQPISPDIQSVGRNAQSSVSWPLGSMRWEWSTLLGRFGIEYQQHALAHSEEDMPPRLLADKFQAKDIPIEHFGPIKIIDVEGGLDEMLHGMVVHGV
jgi:hypothetical protein